MKQKIGGVLSKEIFRFLKPLNQIVPAEATKISKLFTSQLDNFWGNKFNSIFCKLLVRC